MATQGTPSPSATSGGQYKRSLKALGFELDTWAPAKKPSGQKVAELHAPKLFHVCILGKDDYIAVTKLIGCTGLAVYDAASNLAGMYHFGGQFNSLEQAELGEFAGKLSGHHVELCKLQMWLFGSSKCAYANTLLTELRKHGFSQTPSVMEVDGATTPSAAFYLLGTGVVTDRLT